MLGRLVEFILFGFLLWLAYEGVKARVRAFFSGHSSVPKVGRSARPPGQPAETLVRCSECGTHVVPSRALSFKGRPEVYCSERCQGAADRRHRGLS
jgi:hypothetical protein